MRTSIRPGWLAVAVGIVLVALFGPAIVRISVDWLWFGEVGHRSVFWTLLGIRAGLMAVFGLLLTASCLLNLMVARRASDRFGSPRGGPRWQQTMQLLARRGLTIVLWIGSLVLGGIGGLVASSQLDSWLRFSHAQPVGTFDPLFHLDLGFYLFRYPFLSFVSSWLFGVILVQVIAVAAIYRLAGGISMEPQGLRVAVSARTHLSVLLALLTLAKASEYWLDRYALLFHSGGLLYGASYTDVHARLPALNILLAVALLAAAGFLLNARIRALWLPAACVLFMVVASVTIGGLYPSLVQRFSVAPSEQSKERPYIQHHLDATRQAYGLDRIQGREYRRGNPLDAQDLTADRGTLDNIRLWDYRVLSETYQGLQRLRNYYDVSDVDIDRYQVDGRYREVMLAPRQLLTGALDPQQKSWVNQVLQYTHGYGLVMSAVNEADTVGRPSWLISDLPLRTAPGLAVTRPELYYDLRSQPAVVAPSATREFDFPEEAGSSGSAYAASGGIPIGSTLMRWLFATYLGDWNLAISSQVQPNSRILIRRGAAERVAAVAPFLKFDHDPYLVLLNGRLVWVIDGYTTASTYPYSEPTAFDDTEIVTADAPGARSGDDGFNYIRNSVKAVVDGYTGSVTLYASDESDPLLKSYREAFPGLFHSATEITPELRAHLRYPEDLFTQQSQKLGRFHVTNPDVFYARSDVWDIPVELLKQPGEHNNRMQPYYVVMRLPGEAREEFALILPFKTRSGTTMPAWLTARCDGAHYGEVSLYRFSTDYQVDAPEQVDAAIQSDPSISAQVSLLDQGGSVVRYGNLLVLPVGGSLIYVKPLYLEAARGSQEQQAIPVLTRVILAEKRGSSLRVVMQPTLRQALADLVGGEVPPSAAPSAPQTGTSTPAGRPEINRLATEAEQAFQAAETAQRAGNWAEYGRQWQRARDAIRRLRGAAGR